MQYKSIECLGKAGQGKIAPSSMMFVDLRSRDGKG
jgi:hypothetical protein